MSAIERLMAAAMLVLAIAGAGTLWVRHYGAERYEAGRAAAVADGDKLRQAEADRNHKTELDLRADNAAKDAAAFKEKQKYEANLEAAKRRVRAGVDGLRCPAASPVPASAAPADRSTPAGIEVDPAGPALMPEAAEDFLGLAADVAGLVRRYERLEQRFDACREINNK